MKKGKDIIKIVNEKDVDEEIEVEVKREKKFETIRTGITEKKGCEDHKKVNILLNEGDAKIIIDGEEEFLYNVQETLEGLEGSNLEGLIPDGFGF